MKTNILLVCLFQIFCLQSTFAREFERGHNEQADISVICERYYYTSDKQACFKAFQNKQVSKNAMPVCERYYYDNDKQGCALNLADLFISDEALELCQRYYYDNDKQSCLKNLGDLKISESALKTCNSHYYDNDKQACFKDLGTPVRKRGGRPNRDILEKLIQAREALNYGDTDKAKSILDETIDDLK